MSEEHYPGEADAAAADEASWMESMPPHALTREQVERIVDAVYTAGLVSQSHDLDAHDAALRHALSQQAQEFEHLKAAHRQLAMMYHIDMTSAAHKLAAMTMERDEAMGHAASMSNDVTHLGDQLAASQARCGEVELEKTVWKNQHDILQAENERFRGIIAQLQATLAAREAELESARTSLLREGVERDAAVQEAGRLKDTLTFYADPQTYGINGGNVERIIHDAGKLAQRALKKN